MGAVTADVVAVEARRYANMSMAAGGGANRDRHGLADRAVRPGVPEQRVVSLTQRRMTDPAAVIAGLPPDLRPIPSVEAYDELLTRRARAHLDVDGTPAAATT